MALLKLLLLPRRGPQPLSFSQRSPPHKLSHGPRDMWPRTLQPCQSCCWLGHLTPNRIDPPRCLQGFPLFAASLLCFYCYFVLFPFGPLVPITAGKQTIVISFCKTDLTAAVPPSKPPIAVRSTHLPNYLLNHSAPSPNTIHSAATDMQKTQKRPELRDRSQSRRRPGLRDTRYETPTETPDTPTTMTGRLAAFD